MTTKLIPVLLPLILVLCEQSSAMKDSVVSFNLYIRKL